MAKGAKKKSGEVVYLPNKWVKVIAARPGDVCTECGRPLGKGMRWMDGATNACRGCGGRLQRAGRVA